MQVIVKKMGKHFLQKEQVKIQVDCGYEQREREHCHSLVWTLYQSGTLHMVGQLVEWPPQRS